MQSRKAGAALGEPMAYDQWDLAATGTSGESAKFSAAANGRVVVLGQAFYIDFSSDWLLRAYRDRTGEVLWTRQWDMGTGVSEPYAMAAAGDRVLVAGRYQGTPDSPNQWLVRAVHTRTGAPLWTDLGTPPGDEQRAYGIAVSGNRVFVVGSCADVGAPSDWLVRAYDAASGRVVWTDRYDFDDCSDSAKAVAVLNNRVFVAGYGELPSGDTHLIVRAYNARNGQVLWTRPYGVQGYTKKPCGIAVSGNRVIVTGYSGLSPGGSSLVGMVRAYNARNGHLLWDVVDDSYTPDDYKALAVSGDQVFVVGESSTNYLDWAVKVYNLGTGALLWSDSYDLAGGFDFTSGLAVSGNTLFVAGSSETSSLDLDWMVRAYDVATGQMLWTMRYNLDYRDDMAQGLVVSGRQVYVHGYGINTDNNMDWLVRGFKTR